MRWMLKYVTQIVDSKQNVGKQNKSEHQTHDRCGEISDVMWRNFSIWQMWRISAFSSSVFWRNFKFLLMWSYFRFLHMTDVENLRFIFICHVEKSAAPLISISISITTIFTWLTTSCGKGVLASVRLSELCRDISLGGDLFIINSGCIHGIHCILYMITYSETSHCAETETSPDCFSGEQIPPGGQMLAQYPK